MLQIVADVYLKPKESTISEALVAEAANQRVQGKVTDVLSWLDKDRHGYNRNFSVCCDSMFATSEGSMVEKRSLST